MSEPKGKESGLSRSGDLWHSLFGNEVKGGSVEFDKKGPGVDHHVVYGDGFHFSWDSDRQGNVSGVHGRKDK